MAYLEYLQIAAHQTKQCFLVLLTDRVYVELYLSDVTVDITNCQYTPHHIFTNQSLLVHVAHIFYIFERK